MQPFCLGQRFYQIHGGWLDSVYWYTIDFAYWQPNQHSALLLEAPSREFGATLIQVFRHN